jgi:hypothetical protein
VARGSCTWFALLVACGGSPSEPVDAAVDGPIEFDADVDARVPVDAAIDAMPSACAMILAGDPGATSGPYGTPPSFYCDMRGPVVEYDALAVGRYDGIYPEHTMITGTSLQDPVRAAAFVWLYNEQGGMVARATWTIMNACTSSSTGANRLNFGQWIVAIASVSGATFAWDIVEDTLYVVHMGGPMDPPLPSDFFVTNPPFDQPVCGAPNNNAALFFLTR